jgi:hypothetical protein
MANLSRFAFADHALRHRCCTGIHVRLAVRMACREAPASRILWPMLDTIAAAIWADIDI